MAMTSWYQLDTSVGDGGQPAAPLENMEVVHALRRVGLTDKIDSNCIT
jgi:hypothetical protein